MTFQPGQSGNPSGYKASTRRKGNAEIFYEIKDRGYLDPLITLAKLQHESENESVRANAAAALAPYTHPKLQSIPTPRFIDRPFKIPIFQTIEDAKSFLATIPSKIAAGELDLDFAESLTKSTVAWLQLQYAEMGIDLKAQAQGASSGDTTIHIEGGLPALPGTNITMPEINGSASGYVALPEPSTLNPSSIDRVHTAEPVAADALPAPAPPA
jgi:hypothetical protein